MKKYLIAGGGKCGLHFVNKYLDNFKPENQFNQLKEIKTFNDLEMKNYSSDILVAQKSFISMQDIQENLTTFLDEGFEIIHINRFPPQQYLAWFYTLFSNFVNFPKNSYSKNRFDKHFVKWCFDHLEASEELKKFSSFHIEIESFTKEFNIRKTLLKNISDRTIDEVDEKQKTFLISKSNLGTSQNIIEIGFNRYPNIFNDFEYFHLNNYFSKQQDKTQYFEEFKKISPVDTYSNEFWEERIMFYHDVFFKKNYAKPFSKKAFYLKLLESDKIFKRLFYKKFINEDIAFV